MNQRISDHSFLASFFALDPQSGLVDTKHNLLSSPQDLVVLSDRCGLLSCQSKVICIFLKNFHSRSEGRFHLVSDQRWHLSDDWQFFLQVSSISLFPSVSYPTHLRLFFAI